MFWRTTAKMWDGMENHFQSQRHLTLNDETASSKTLRHEDAGSRSPRGKTLLRVAPSGGIE